MEAPGGEPSHPRMKKHVVSSTPSEPLELKNSELITGDAMDEVAS
jgi:hypothetical protein